MATSARCFSSEHLFIEKSAQTASSKRGRRFLEDDDDDTTDEGGAINAPLEVDMDGDEDEEDEEEALQELLEQRRRKRGPGVHWDSNGRAADLSAYIRERASGNQNVQPPAGYQALNTDHYGCPCLYHSESGVIVKDEYPTLCRNRSLALLCSRVSYLYMSPEAFEEQCRNNRRGPQHRQECRSAPSADTWQWLSSTPPEAIRPVPSSETDMFSCDVELRFCVPVLHEVDDKADFAEAMSESSTLGPSSMHDLTSLRLNSESFSEESPTTCSLEFNLQ